METDSQIIRKIKKNLKKTKVINIDDIDGSKISNTNDLMSDNEEDFNMDELGNSEYVEYAEMDELVKLVEMYTDMDDENRKLKIDMNEKIKNDKIRSKKLEKDKKLIDEKIMIHLEKMGEGRIILEDGKLIKNTYVKQAPIDTQMILNALNENDVKNQKVMKSIIQSIEKQKKIKGTRREQLKRTFNRKDKK
jgi:hypothetical protein